MSSEPTFDADGSVTVAVETVAGVAGPRMAASVAGSTVWWPDDAVAKRARNGLPRPPSQLAGQVTDAHWDAQRGVVLARIVAVDKLADLLRRFPRMLRFARRGAEGLEVLMTRGASPPARTALLEAAITTTSTSGGNNVPTMTLREALQQPEVIGHLKRELGLSAPSPPVPVAVTPRARRLSTANLTLLEAMTAQPSRRAPADDGLRDFCERRGMDPRHFGVGGGEAA